MTILARQKRPTGTVPWYNQKVGKDEKVAWFNEKIRSTPPGNLGPLVMPDVQAMAIDNDQYGKRKLSRKKRSRK